MKWIKTKLVTWLVWRLARALAERIPQELEQLERQAMLTPGKVDDVAVTALQVLLDPAVRTAEMTSSLFAMVAEMENRAKLKKGMLGDWGVIFFRGVTNTLP